MTLTEIYDELGGILFENHAGRSGVVQRRVGTLMAAIKREATPTHSSLAQLYGRFRLAQLYGRFREEKKNELDPMHFVAINLFVLWCQQQETEQAGRG